MTRNQLEKIRRRHLAAVEDLQISYCIERDRYHDLCTAERQWRDFPEPEPLGMFGLSVRQTVAICLAAVLFTALGAVL